MRLAIIYNPRSTILFPLFPPSQSGYGLFNLFLVLNHGPNSVVSYVCLYRLINIDVTLLPSYVNHLVPGLTAPLVIGNSLTTQTLLTYMFAFQRLVALGHHGIPSPRLDGGCTHFRYSSPLDSFTLSMVPVILSRLPAVFQLINSE